MTNPEPLEAVLLPCRHCSGTGEVMRWRCTTCVDRHYFQCVGLEESDFPPAPPLYTDAEIHRRADPPTFPRCGHEIMLGRYTLNATLVPCYCPKCQGSRNYAIYLTPEQAAARREKKQRKNENERKRILSAAGIAVKCGAMTRAGLPCTQPCDPGMAVCRYHGGRSTGPRTPEGRQRVNDARWPKTRGQAGIPTP